MPAASAFFDEDDLGAQRRRRGAMEASGEEKGEGRWRRGGREREKTAAGSMGHHSRNRSMRRPLAFGQDQTTATRPRGLAFLPLQAAAARAASELGCRARRSTGVDRTVLHRRPSSGWCRRS